MMGGEGCVAALDAAVVRVRGDFLGSVCVSFYYIGFFTGFSGWAGIRTAGRLCVEDGSVLFLPIYKEETMREDKKEA